MFGIKKRFTARLLCAILATLTVGLTACSGGGNTETEQTKADAGAASHAENRTADTATATGSGQDKTADSPTDTADTAGTADSTELIVFAAASMTETLTQLAETYQTVAPGVHLTFNFDSSGTLKTQIQEGADCDVFISAAQKQMDQLDSASENNPEGLDFVLAGTRVDLLENKVVLVTPAGNPAGITSFADVGQASLLVLGNADVPVGQYAQEIFTSLGLWDTLNAERKITFAGNVKEVTAQVAEGTADCGVIYVTDARSAIDAGSQLEVIAEAPADSHQPVIYPAAVLNGSHHLDEAKAFLAFLQTDASSVVFEAVGFSVPKDND